MFLEIEETLHCRAYFQRLGTLKDKDVEWVVVSVQLPVNRAQQNPPTGRAC
jgi:hypothetical protein